MPQTAKLAPRVCSGVEHKRTIPDAVIESIKKRISLFSLLSGYGITPVQRGNTWFITCPFHRDPITGVAEKVPSCSVSREKNEYHCFSCNESGDNVRFVMLMEKISFPAAVKRLLAIKPADSLVKQPDDAAKETVAATLALSEEERQAILAEVVRRSVEDLRNSEGGRRYLESRGLEPLTLLESYTLGFWNGKTFDKLESGERKKLAGVGLVSGIRALFENCIVFPLVKEGRIATMYGRKTMASNTPEGRHYLLPHRREGLYLPKQGLNPHLPVIITESIIDALSLFTAGVTNVLPLLGVNGFLPDHLAYLKEQSFPQIFIALNGDEAGNRAAAALKEQLVGNGLQSTIIELPAGKDINDMLRETCAEHGRSMGAAKLKAWFDERSGEQAQPGAKPTVWEDEAGDTFVTIENREYRIRGLSPVGMDRLKVNVKAGTVNNRDMFYVDTLDLYQAKSREVFVNQSARAFECEPSRIARDVNALITLLEELRLKKKDGEEGGRRRYKMSEEEKREALEYLRSPELLERIAADFEACGMVGNRNQNLLSYLGALSRLTEHPFGTLIVSRSGAGKSYLQDMIATMTPEESLLCMTRLTGQSLFYQGKEGLKHKLLTIEEDEGMQDAMYSIRTLLSSQKLTVHGLKTDSKSGEFKAYENTVHGPASVMISTTNLSAFTFENVNRFFTLFLDESREQTRAILEHQQRMAGLAKINLKVNRQRIEKLHKNIQRLIKPVMVINTIGTGIEYPADILNTRREATKTEALIETVALLHQYQRTVKTATVCGVQMQYIEVTKEDIDAVHAIAGDILQQSLDEMPRLCRDLLGIIHELVNEKFKAMPVARDRDCPERWQISFTRKELADKSRWSRWHLEEHLKELEEAGYIVQRIGKKGQRYAYSLVEDTIPVIPSVKRSI